jgi:hypothetical protein
MLQDDNLHAHDHSGLGQQSNAVSGCIREPQLLNAIMLQFFKKVIQVSCFKPKSSRSDTCRKREPPGGFPSISKRTEDTTSSGPRCRFAANVHHNRSYTVQQRSHHLFVSIIRDEQDSLATDIQTTRSCNHAEQSPRSNSSDIGDHRQWNHVRPQQRHRMRMNGWSTQQNDPLGTGYFITKAVSDE